MDMTQLEQDRLAVMSRLGFYEWKEKNPSAADEEWYAQDNAQDLRTEYIGYSQYQSIAKKQSQRLQARASTMRENFTRLFMSSKLGFSRPGIVGRRNTSDQSNFVQAMMKECCPEPLAEGTR